MPAPPGLHLVADAAELRAVVARLGAEISAALPGGAVLAAVLKGTTPFLADLCRAVTVPVTLELLMVSPYTPGTGRVRIVHDLDCDVAGADVVLVEDIVDTGLTTAYLLGELRQRAVSSASVCTLVDRTCRRVVPVPVRWRGHEVGDEHLIGYGLDHEERYRNLPALYAAPPEVLRTRSGDVAAALHGGGGEVSVPRLSEERWR